MKNFATRAGFVSWLILSVVSDFSPAVAQVQAFPRISVLSCSVAFVGVGGAESVAAGMSVRFENESTETLNSITLRALTPAGTIDISVDGTFSPGAIVRRNLQYRGSKVQLSRWAPMRYSMDVSGPGVCRAVKATSAGGNVTANQFATATPFYIPEAPLNSAASVPASMNNEIGNPIGIVSCQFSILRGRASGNVRYRNLSDKPIRSVVFRARFGDAGLDFVNSGTFSPGAFIRSSEMRTDLPQGAFSEYITLDSPTSCVAVKAVYSTGEIWQNPMAGEVPPPFPSDDHSSSE